MSDRLIFHVVQSNSSDDPQENLQTVLTVLSAIPGQAETQWVSFPENVLYLRVKEGESIPGWTLESEGIAELKTLAQQKNLLIHLGSAPFEASAGKKTNASLVVTPDGKAKIAYEKIHLFDIQLEGKPALKESDAFAHGQSTQVLEWQGWKFGLSICYDIRFAELYLQYAKQGVDGILVPAAFLPETGEAHWETLLRARAIESQCYVLAAAQAGVHQSRRHPGLQRKTHGHSLVVDPWGRVMAKASSEGAQVLTVTLEKSEIAKVRRQIPMASHRRL